jgi:hypothetical protein
MCVCACCCVVCVLSTWAATIIHAWVCCRGYDCLTGPSLKGVGYLEVVLPVSSSTTPMQMGWSVEKWQHTHYHTATQYNQTWHGPGVVLTAVLCMLHYPHQLGLVAWK